MIFKCGGGGQRRLRKIVLLSSQQSPHHRKTPFASTRGEDMNTELVKDILLKAAEDVQSGMWCRAEWFKDAEIDDWPNGSAYQAFQGFSPENLQQKERCAEGSILLATYNLGGDQASFYTAVAQVVRKIGRLDCSDHDWNPCSPTLWEYNDRHTPIDPFEAGQQLAELFRSTAEAL